MKIEMKPLSEIKKPRYAAALALLASAALLTGCGTAGEVMSENPVPGAGISEDDLQIMGDEQFIPDSSEPDDVELMGDAPPPRNVDDSIEVELMGDAPPEESRCGLEGDVVLEGEMVNPDQAPPPEVIPGSTGSTVCGDLFDQSDRLTADREDDFDMIAAEYAGIIGTQAEFIRPVVTVDGMEMLSAGYFPDRPCLFFWFAQDDVTREWLERLLPKTPFTEYDWGVICEGSYDGQSCPIVLLSTEWGKITPEDAVKIAGDVLS